MQGYQHTSDYIKWNKLRRLHRTRTRKQMASMLAVRRFGFTENICVTFGRMLSMARVKDVAVTIAELLLWDRSAPENSGGSG